MQEVRERRELIQTRKDGKVFRYAQRFYKLSFATVGVIRVLDGPPELQGFYAVDQNAQRSHLPKIKSWQQMERILRTLSPGMNGGSDSNTAGP